MKINRIITNRLYETWPSYHLVNEWEDVFSQCLKAPLLYEKLPTLRRILRHVPPAYQNPHFISFLLSSFFTKNKAFVFEMNTDERRPEHNNPNIIPCIIDFYLKRDVADLSHFYSQYDKNSTVLVSSMEAYEYLKSKKCPLNIKHLALSISDKYRIESTTNYHKQYDLILVGRQNPVLEKYIKQYSSSHPSFIYVYRQLKGHSFNYYTSDGKELGDISSREKYMELMSKGRVGLYSTPGIDGGEIRTNGFNQVTPRFLELIASGCHIIARYEDNPDTRYYELDKFSPSVSSYSQFEELMDDYLKREVDMEFYSEYLSKHYTSVRCKELTNIINSI